MPDEVTVDDLDAARKGGAIFIDVRESDEYAAGHVPGAQLVPLGLVPERVRDLLRNERCTSSAPAAAAAPRPRSTCTALASTPARSPAAPAPGPAAAPGGDRHPAPVEENDMDQNETLEVNGLTVTAIPSSNLATRATSWTTAAMPS